MDHQAFPSQFIPSDQIMIFKILIAYLVLHLVSASFEEDSNAAAVERHERAPIPGSLVPLPEIAASSKGIHLSVNTGTPGVWYSGTGAPFNPQDPVNYWTASDSTGQFPSVASKNGPVYVSDDYGVTWSARGASRAHTSITSDATGNRLAVTVNNEGVYLSSDRGTTWTLANITDASSYTWAEISSDHSGQYLTAFGSNAGFIYFSHNYGASWSSTTNPCNYVVESGTMSHDGQYQYATKRNSECALRSTNYGATWTEMTDIGWARSIACNGNGQRLVAVANNDFGIFGSTDYGTTWTKFDHPTGSWVTYGSIVMDTSGLNIVVAGWDLKAVIASADGGATWSYITPTGGDFATTWPHRMVGDASANHLLIAFRLKTTINPLITPALPEFTPTTNPSKTPTSRPTGPSAMPSFSTEPTAEPTAEPSSPSSLFPVPSPTTQSGVCPSGTILLSNQCAVCPAGTYAGSGFAQCMPCPAGTYSGAWSTTCQVSPVGFFALEGAAQASMCPAGTVSGAGSASCTACPAGQYSYPGTSTCLSCASSA